MQDKKSKHSFLCRDSLYELFVQMSQRLDCSVDYLINEAMREYASKNIQQSPSARPPDELPREERTVDFVPEPPRGQSSQSARDLGLLIMISDGVQVVIDKEQFVLGRGSQGTDFVVRDPNISRRHAVIQQRDDGYYIKDLGSTNGIEYKGASIEEKKIEDGDVFKLCTHLIEFKYQQ